MILILNGMYLDFKSIVYEKKLKTYNIHKRDFQGTSKP